MKKIILASTGFLMSVSVAFAATGLGGVLETIKTLIGTAVPVIIGLAVALFLWGIIKYVTTGDAKDKEAAKGYMIWGIIGLFVMVSVWGLVKLLSDTFGTGNTGTVPTTYTI